MKIAGKTEYALVIYVGFFLAVNLTGGSFFSDIGWAPYIESTSNSNPPSGAAWIENKGLHWADGSNEYYMDYRPLVGEWHLDSGSGSTAVDLSSSGNDGTINGATWTSGRHGQALSFDGSNDYVDVSSSTLKLHEFTVSAWIYRESESSWDSILTSDDGNGNRNWFFGGNSGDPCIHYMVDDQGDSNEGINCGGSIPLNDWTHVVATHSGYDGTMKLYVDGSLAATHDFTGAVKRTSTASIGANKDGSKWAFDGKIDEVMVFSRDISAQEVQNLYNGAGSRTGGSSGNAWVEKNSLHWVDQDNVERSFTGGLETIEEDGDVSEYTIEETSNTNHNAVTSPKTSGEYSREVETTTGADSNYRELTYTYADTSPSWSNFSVNLPNPANGNWILKKQFHTNNDGNVVTSIAFDGSDAGDISILNPSSGWTVVESNYPADEWIEVSLKWDWSNDQVDVYVNGIQKVSNHGFRTSTSYIDSNHEYWDYREGYITGYVDDETTPETSYMPSASAGKMWMENGNIHFIDETGRERVIAN